MAPFKDQDFSKYNFNVSQLLMGNVKFKTDEYSIAYNHLFIHNNNQSIGDYFGKDDPQDDGDLEFQRRQQTNNNELYVNQLLANYQISDRLDIEAKGSLNFIRGNEPDRRTNKYLLRDGFYNPQTSSAGENERYFSKLQENLWEFLQMHCQSQYKNFSVKINKEFPSFFIRILGKIKI